jgi:hypothetical protein
MVTVPHGVYDACTSCMHASILQKLKIHAEIYIHAYIITSICTHASCTIIMTKELYIFLSASEIILFGEAFHLIA